MRDKIKAVATELLIRHGYHGLRFADIAQQLDITRANIHYHFGTKNALAKEVLTDYIARTTEKMAGVWCSDIPYEDKVIATMELNRKQYLLFNKSNDEGGAPWSLISRMRLEADQIDAEGRACMVSFSRAIESYVAFAIAKAQANGEIARNAPVDDIAVQIVSIIESAGPITQDAGSFARLEHLYMAHMRVITHAYVNKRRRAARAVAV
jgi:TetR/AcrR family transcriptional repressor of nem operon